MGRAGGVSVELLAPRPLSVQHQLAAFDSGEAVLDDWLKRRALANHVAGASRVFVVADAQGRVYGYYALAAGAVSHKEAIGAVRRNMPDPVPVMVLGRQGAGGCAIAGCCSALPECGRECGRSRLAGACLARQGTRLLRALWIPAVTGACTDLDASPEHCRAWHDDTLTTG